ncbi:MAG: RAD55 family ATPase, partial [Candidatus Syntropharchaeia archaeon]
ESINGYTLEVKGAPGVGKTIFALTLLKEIYEKEKRDAIYFSTRIDPELLYVQFPWIKDYIPQNSIIDATQSEYSLKMEVAEQIRYSDLVEFFRAVYERAVRANTLVLIIDSWDAVIFQIGKNNKEKLENSMMDLARKTKTNLVLVTELAREDPLDYLVDGIIRLEKIEKDGGWIRKIYMDKMRGMALEKTSYPFTLDGGIFTYFPPHESVKPLSVYMTSENKKSHFSTGYPSFDNFLGGGYPRGSIVLLEMSEGVSPSLPYLLISPIISNFISKKRNVIMLPMMGTEKKVIKKQEFPFIENEDFEKNMQVIEEKEEFFSTFNKIKRGDFLSIIGTDRLELNYGEKGAMEFIGALVPSVRGAQGVLLLLARSDIYRDMADVHLKLVSFDETFAIHGIKPNKGIHNIKLDTSKGHAELSLTPYL